MPGGSVIQHHMYNGTWPAGGLPPTSVIEKTITLKRQTEQIKIQNKKTKKTIKGFDVAEFDIDVFDEEESADGVITRP